MDKEVAFVGFDHFSVRYAERRGSLGNLNADFISINSNLFHQFAFSGCLEGLSSFQSAAWCGPECLTRQQPGCVFKFDEKDALIGVKQK